jgi:ribosome-binding factor A
MSKRRPERLAEQIREEVSMIIAGEIEDPRVGFATVTEARLSPDLRYAKIYVTVVGSESEIKESLAALNHAARFVRRQLAATLRMKYTPELHFVYDEATATAARIEELLSEEVAKAQGQEEDRADDAIKTSEADS